jgi:hypothetical protein
MRTPILAGLAATALLAGAPGSTPAQAMPAQPSAISQANEAASNVVDVQYRRRFVRPYRYYGPPPWRYAYRPYPYYAYGYPYRYYSPGPFVRIGPFGFGFGW